MLDASIILLKNFRERIYNFFSSRRDASMELVDSLSSNTSARSVVELSLNTLHRRNYCSLTRVVDEFYPLHDTASKRQQNKQVTQLLSTACPPLKNQKYHVFGVDCTSNPRIFSSTLEDRGLVHKPNPIIGNKPITIGHQYSIAAYFPEKTPKNEPPWIIPLSCERVGTDEKGTMIGMKQITSCIESQEFFKKALCISVGDSAYAHPACLAEAQKNPNQIHISRSRNNRIFYYPLEQSDQPKERGRPQYYGDKHNLKKPETWRTPDETITFETTNKKGKIQKVEIQCWNNIIMRGNRQANVADYSFRLLRISVYNSSSGELLFKKPLWLIVTGERRQELSLQEIFNIYRQRFDIEHFFRFGKDRLLMNKTQTPDIHHEEAWWQLVIMAYVQLYLAREIAENIWRPWEKSLPAAHASTQERSPTHVQRDFERIIRQIGTPAQPLKPRKKSLGRQLGDIQVPRQHYDVVRKNQKMASGIAVLT
jgi:DDE superfamily endonuclease